MPNDMEIEECLKGLKLYGDDFPIDKIKEWFENQKEAYAELGAKKKEEYRYGYHALDIQNGYRHLPPIRFGRVLGIGSAYGDEFEPIKERIGNLVIVDPSDAFVSDRVLGIPTLYRKPHLDGSLDFPDNSFDLITSFAVLQHIPNVTRVIQELYRCLKPGGYALIREAIVSLGDWRHPRKGVTREQRGIPLVLFRKIISSCRFKVIKETKCMFSLTSQIIKFTGYTAYNSPAITFFDKVFSSLFSWNTRYHRVHFYQKFGPRSVFYVLSKG